MTTQGRRCPDETGPFEVKPGEYCRYKGRWAMRAPNEAFVLLDPENPNHHKVIENPDGTLTVTPSLLISETPIHRGWHGFLTNGVWTEC